MFFSDFEIRVMSALQDKLGAVPFFLYSGRVCVKLELFLPKLLESSVEATCTWSVCVCSLPSFSSVWGKMVFSKLLCHSWKQKSRLVPQTEPHCRWVIAERQEVKSSSPASCAPSTCQPGMRAHLPVSLRPTRGAGARRLVEDPGHWACRTGQWTPV